MPARVTEQVDVAGLKPAAARRTGSIPVPRTRVDLVATSGYIGSMHSIGIKTLKNRLSEFVRVAAAGETVLVTDRGRVVAELADVLADLDASRADR